MIGRLASRQGTPASNAFDYFTVVQMMQKLADMHAQVLDAVEKIQSIAVNIDEIKRGPQGQPGVQGASVDHSKVVADVVKQIPKPSDGKSPRVEALAAALLPKMTAYFKDHMPQVADGAPGKDAAEIDINVVVDRLFEALKSGEKKLTMTQIDGLDGRVAELRNHVATSLAGAQYGKDTWARGGGDTVKAGSNVTITTDADGKKVITATSGFGIITITGTVDDSNVSFTATSQPTLLNINGAFYQKTGGTYTWTYVAGTITLSTPVGTGGQIFGV